MLPTTIESNGGSNGPEGGPPKSLITSRRGTPAVSNATLRISLSGSSDSTTPIPGAFKYPPSRPTTLRPASFNVWRISPQYCTASGSVFTVSTYIRTVIAFAFRAVTKSSCCWGVILRQASLSLSCSCPKRAWAASLCASTIFLFALAISALACANSALACSVCNSSWSVRHPEFLSRTLLDQNCTNTNATVAQAADAVSVPAIKSPYHEMSYQRLADSNNAGSMGTESKAFRMVTAISILGCGH